MSTTLGDGIMEERECTSCQTMTDPLEMFPGDKCLKCWALSPEGRYLPTAGELAHMWGAR